MEALRLSLGHLLPKRLWQEWEPQSIGTAGKVRSPQTLMFDQVTRKQVRPYQEMAIAKTLWEFAQGNDRVLLLMATGTGKTFTVFQLIWKLMNGGALTRQHVLFLTDRNSLKDQAYRAFSTLIRTSESLSTNRPWLMVSIKWENCSLRITRTLMRI